MKVSLFFRNIRPEFSTYYLNILLFYNVLVGVEFICTITLSLTSVEQVGCGKALGCPALIPVN